MLSPSRCNQNPGSHLPPFHYGSCLGRHFYREKTRAIFSLVDSRRIALAHATRPQAVSCADQILSFRCRPDRIFSCDVRKSKQSSYAKKSHLLYVQRFEQTPRPTAVVMVWRRETTSRVHCTARRTQASESTLTAFRLAPKTRAESARVSLSWYLVFRHSSVTDFCCSCCCCSLRARMHREVHASALLLVSTEAPPSTRQPTVVWPRRDAPPADCPSGATQRRYSAVSPSNSSIVRLLLAVVDNLLNLDDGLGHRIPKSTKNRSELAYSECLNRCFQFWDKKLQI